MVDNDKCLNQHKWNFRNNTSERVAGRRTVSDREYQPELNEISMNVKLEMYAFCILLFVVNH